MNAELIPLTLGRNPIRRGTAYVAKMAQEMLDNGGGLSELEIQRWYARLDAIYAARANPPPPPEHVAAFRETIENRFVMGQRFAYLFRQEETR